MIVIEDKIFYNIIFGPLVTLGMKNSRKVDFYPGHQNLKINPKLFFLAKIAQIFHFHFSHTGRIFQLHQQTR